MKYDYKWSVWLKSNQVLKIKEEGYIAEVLTAGRTLHNEDLARRMIDDGTEIRYETLLNIFNQRDRLVNQALQEGYSVLTESAQFTPHVSGRWHDGEEDFDPDRHRLTVTITPSAALRRALTNVGVKVIGMKPSAAMIQSVTDTFTGRTDGTAKAGSVLMIKGRRLRVAPTDEAGLGVFFTDGAGTLFPVVDRLVLNDPTRLMVRVPALPPGDYRLTVVTRFSASAVLLKQPRTIEWNQPIHIE